MLLYIGLFTDNAFLFGFGVYNDLAVIAQYGLAVPVVAAFQRMLAPIAPHQMTVATGSALVGVGGVVVFQVLFLAGVISLQQAFGLVGAAMVLLVGAWILITGFVGRRAAMLQNSTALLVLAALYFGYRSGRSGSGGNSSPRQEADPSC